MTTTVDRFDLLELDLPSHPMAPPPVQAAPQRAMAPIAATAAVVTDRDFSPVVRSLAQQEVEIAAEAGFAVKGVDDGLLFEAGTKFWDIGEDQLRIYAAEYARLPTLKEAAATLGATIALEARSDKIAPLATWRLDIRGRLRSVVPDSDGGLLFARESIAVSSQAVSQIQGYYPHDKRLGRGKAGRSSAGGAAARQQWPSDRPLPPPPANINGWIGDLTTKAKDGVVAPTNYRLRARTHRGQREIFGVFSGSKRGYVPFDADKLLALAADLQPNLRVEVQYDADTTRTKARVVAQAPIDIPAFNGVGRVHRIGFDLITADDGSSSLECRPFLIRVRCKNASLVTVHGKRTAFRHVGTFEALRDSMTAALTNAAAGIEPMRQLWARAAAEHYLDTETGAQLSVEAAIERLIAHEYVPMGGLSAEEAKAAYLAAWRAEDSPHSAMGIIMALQRAAHETAWSSKWAEDEVEAAASQLLYQNVYRLDNPETDDEE